MTDEAEVHSSSTPEVSTDQTPTPESSESPKLLAYTIIALIGLIWLIGSAYLGMQHATVVGSHFIPPQSIDRQIWQVISPGMNEDISNPTLGRGTHIVDNALSITELAFFTSDKLTLKKRVDVKEIELQLAPDSDSVVIKLFQHKGGGNLPIMVEIQPQRFTSIPSDGTWTPSSGKGKYLLTSQPAGFFLIDGETKHHLGHPTVGELEITTNEGEARIQAIKIVSSSGDTVVNKDYQKRSVPQYVVEWGRNIGFTLGLAFLIIIRGRRLLWLKAIFASSLIALPVWVSTFPLSTWLMLGERLYLTQTNGWNLATMVFAASFLPLLFLILSRSGLGLRKVATSSRWDIPSLIVWSLLALLALYYTGLPTEKWLWCVLALVFVCIPLWLACRQKVPTLGWLMRDIPALLAIAVFGWGFAFFIAAFWRISMIMASLPVLLRNQTRHTVDTLFVLTLTLPITIEIAARQTYLDHIWQVENLTLNFIPDENTNYVQQMRKERCNNPKSKERKSLLFHGGSSTGGEFQFRNNPEYFFPTQAHYKLCKRIRKNQHLVTYNYGRGAVDTHIIARTLDDVFAENIPDVMVLYIGVNDLLSQFYPKTKRQREEIMKNWRSNLSVVQQWSSKLRIMIGGGLLIRPVRRSKKTVPNVPVSDARLNLQSIVEQTEKNGVKLLLMTEFLRSDLKSQTEYDRPFMDYQRMQEYLAENNEHVYFYDIWNDLLKHKEEEILADSNHLTQFGNQILAQYISPTIHQLLFSEKPQEQPTEGDTPAPK